MAGSLIGNNVTLKVNAAASGTATSAGTLQTLYTSPANAYAIVQISCTTFGGTCVVTINSRQVCVFTAVNQSFFNIYVGPSRTVSINATSSTTVDLSGVEFINSP